MRFTAMTRLAWAHKVGVPLTPKAAEPSAVAGPRALRPQWVSRLLGRPRYGRHALALAGGGVVGGMYEVGARAALEEYLPRVAQGFDLYVGSSAGAVVASFLAHGISAQELYQILEQDRPAVAAGDDGFCGAHRPAARGQFRDAHDPEACLGRSPLAAML